MKRKTLGASAGWLATGSLLVVAACGGDTGNRPAANAAVDSARAEGTRDTTARSDTATSPTGDPVTHDWLIVPGERVGPVTLSTSEAELRARLGDRAVLAREVYLAEGFCTPGTVLFPGTADSLDIAWTDSARTRPAFVRITGPGSRWTTPAGVRIGSTLEELEAIHGGPLTFSGFGWDYGGGLGWPEPDDDHVAGLRINPDSASWETAGRDPAWNGILGDRSVRSDDPLIRKLTIVVESIGIGAGASWEEHECRDLR